MTVQFHLCHMQQDRLSEKHVLNNLLLSAKNSDIIEVSSLD